MIFRPDFISKLEAESVSDPYPVKLDDVCEQLGFGGKYSALELVQAYFEECEDYTLHANTCYLSVTCLRELALLSNSPQGRIARRYLLDCEQTMISVAQSQTIPKEVTVE